MPPRFAERVLAWLGGGLLRRLTLGAAALALLMGLGGLAMSSAGLVSISASSGHWPVTSWFLHHSMRRAVSTQSLGITVPDLSDPALVLKGAGHYETGCLPCHGAPGRDQSLIVKQMTPRPPVLPPRVDHWQARELFWIVRHGIKFTAMPAWPALKRDDEVWAIVAFLQQLPQMSAQRYADLALNHADQKRGSSGTPDHLRPLADPLGPVIDNCARCHGADGAGRGEDAFPVLAGQNREYLLASLQAYATGQRASGVMQPIAAGLDADVLAQLADYYAGLPAVAKPGLPDPDRQAVARGRKLAATGSREQKVASCVQCHGPADSARNPLYPELAGQYPQYLALQLQLFASGERGGTRYADIMHIAANRLTESQRQDLAAFYASLSPESSPEKNDASSSEP